ncbi:hypothetical protein QQ008_30175 [Fulvivirgaceae bacterium BMA10]|uniref:Lipocalin-like domain-containing protein n=1 Tax=Splendidivirga corallicola TaxID=3051826 RepID=A0ABT8KY21_9BACT|nr:hypothetical protein [Fulvivirgaceae bacterium BMA10]
MKKLNKFLAVAIVIIFIASCNNDDEMDLTPPILTEKQLQGNWRISYFWDQTVRTNEYQGFVFTFINSDIDVDANGTDINGTYDIWFNQINGQQHTILDVVFADAPSINLSDKMRELREDWIVKKISENGNNIEFEELQSNNPPEILHFTRITN